MKKTFVIVNPETDNMSNPLPYLYLIFKAYYTEFGQYPDQWNWPLPIGDTKGFTFDELVERIVCENPTLVGFSNYLWNYQANAMLAAEVKKRLPSTLIVMGGPQVTYDKSISWFKENPWVDLVATTDGNGEEFIKVLLDQLAVDALDPDKIPLCIYPTADRASWKRSSAVVARQNFKWPKSMFNGNETEVMLLNHMAQAKGGRLTTVWETTRGCPYSCAYCDWGGGTGTKILKKDTETLHEELRFMEKMNVQYLEVCDANFGIFKERDLAIVDHLIERANQGWDIQVAFDGKTKSDIEIANTIDRKLIESKIQYDYDYHFSVSASDPAINKAINRSAFQTQKQVEFISKIKDTGYRIRLELIIGLPEATLESFYKEYITIAAADGWLTERFVWLMLNKSPASKPAYIEKYKIKTVSVKYPYLRALRQSREDYSILYDEKYQGMFDVIVETASYTRDEWVQMYFMDKFAGGLECCEITTSVRLRAEQLGINPGQFFRICWDALTGLTGEAKASFDLIIQNINSALDGKAGIASYMYKGNDLILQLISPLFVAEFREDFYLQLKSRLPNDSILNTALLEMKTFLQQINSTKDAHLLVAKIYEEFAYQEEESNKKTIA